jgi:TPR repeat protein
MCDNCHTEIDVLPTKVPICKLCFQIIGTSDAVKYGRVIECFGTLSDAEEYEKKGNKQKAALIYVIHGHCARLGKGFPYYYVIPYNYHPKDKEEHLKLGKKYQIDEPLPQMEIVDEKTDEVIEDNMVSEKALKDYDSAYQYYEKAANLGSDEALFYIASCYFLGQSVKKDDNKAAEIWYDLHVRKYADASYMLLKLVKYNYLLTEMITSNDAHKEIEDRANSGEDVRFIILHAEIMIAKKQPAQKYLDMAIKHKDKGLIQSKAYYLKYCQLNSTDVSKKVLTSLLRDGAYYGNQNCQTIVSKQLF